MSPLFSKGSEAETACQTAENKRLAAEGAEDSSVSSTAVERLLLMRSAEKELNAALEEK